MAGGIHPPLAVIQAWPKPNHINPVQRGPGLVILCAIMMALVLLLIIARLWARGFLQHKLGLDDLLISLSFIPTLGLGLGISLGSRLYGFDRHAWDETPSMLENSRKITFSNEITYIVATSLIKISILVFYRRMAFQSLSKPFLLALRLAIASVLAYMVAFFCVLWTVCRPYDAFWKQVNIDWLRAGNKYQCIDEGGYLLAGTAITVAQDFITATLPLTLFWKLQISKRQKIALAGIFALGYLTCIVGVVRIYYIWKLFYDTYDVPWVAVPLWAWTMLEVSMGTICACAPALKVYFARYFNASLISGRISKLRTRSKSRVSGATDDSSRGNSDSRLRSIEIYGSVPPGGGGKGSKKRFGTQASVISVSRNDRNGDPQGDLEMGGIGVSKEVEVTCEGRYSESVYPPSFVDKLPTSAPSKKGPSVNTWYLGDSRPNSVQAPAPRAI